MLITIDPFYDVQFYNNCREALKNNGVAFKEYVSTKAPYNFYFEVDKPPTFINYEVAPDAYSRHLISLVTPLRSNDEYLLLRRESFVNKQAVDHYGVNDALQSANVTKEGVFFTSSKEEVLRISREFPRKIYFMGRYYDKRYKLFFSDSLLIKNYLLPKQILVQSKDVKDVTELEKELNYRVFMEKDRLEKLSTTPYVINGGYYPASNVRPDLADKFTLT